MSQSTAHAGAIADAVKVTPPVTVSGLSLGGVELPDIVLVVTLIYTILNLYVLIRDKFVKRKKDGSE